jgi:hypothetical protein
LLRPIALLLLLGSTSACNQLTLASEGSAAPICRQVDEFLKFGCARIVARVLQSDDTPAHDDRISISVSPVDSSAQWFLSAYERPRTDGSFALIAYRMFDAAPTDRPDTVTVRIRARLHDRPRDYPVNTPLPVIASDSTDRRITLVPMGARPVVDTVVLRLRSH